MRESRSFLRQGIVRREQVHRRTLFVGLAVLLLLSMSPVFGHHVPSGAAAYLADRDYVWALCLVALHILLAPVHDVFHALFFGGLGYAIWDRVRAWRAMRRELGRLPTAQPRPGGVFWKAAIEAGVRPESLHLVRGLPTPAFAAGWWRPRIYVAAELVDHLSPAELTALLAHEGAHLARRDPMRLSALRFLTCMLFWLRAMRDLAEDIADEAEIQADDAAARHRPLALASALVSLAQWNPPRAVSYGAVAFDGRDLLDRRVRRLAGDEVTPKSRVTGRSVIWAAIALALAWTSGAVMAHPLPGDSPSHAEHCNRGASLPSHLFCAGFSLSPPPEGCPHRTAGRS